MTVSNIIKIMVDGGGRMIEKKYEVSVDNDRIAFGMNLDDALLFVKAYFEKYYMETRMILSIKEMERVEEC